MDPKKRKKAEKAYEESDIPTTFKSIKRQDHRHTGHVPAGNMYSPTDPNGSYTGMPYDTDEVPVQDADDL